MYADYNLHTHIVQIAFSHWLDIYLGCVRAYSLIITALDFISRWIFTVCLDCEIILTVKFLDLQYMLESWRLPISPPFSPPHCKTFKWNLTNAERGGAGATAMVHLLGDHNVPLMGCLYVSLILCWELWLFEVLCQSLAVSQLLHSFWAEAWREKGRNVTCTPEEIINMSWTQRNRATSLQLSQLVQMLSCHRAWLNVNCSL